MAVSSSLGQDGTTRSGKAASSRRRQLHILYLLNDLLHHLRFHAQDSRAFSAFSQSIQPHILDAVSHAAAHNAHVFVKQHARIQTLIGEWETNRYFDHVFFENLRKAARQAGETENAGQSVQAQVSGEVEVKTKRETPFFMPATHGDPTAPYHELPAGNMMPHIIPNTSIPISPAQMKPLQFAPGPADPKLTEAVKSFLKEADAIYGTQDLDEDEGISMEMDELGQSIMRDKASGEVLGGESYYGWSKDFCTSMKRKQTGRRRSRSRSSSPRRSNSPRKRPRYASSYSSHSRSRSRSRSPPPRLGRRHHNSYSPSRSRSRSPLHFSGAPQRPYSPPSASHPTSNSSSAPPPPLPPPPPAAAPPRATIPQPPTMMPPNIFPNGMPPLGPNGFPLPPPRPPNWQGPWPPPPPPPPAGPSQGQSQIFLPQGMAYPPPPPAPEMAGQAFGQGGSGYGYGQGQGQAHGYGRGGGLRGGDRGRGGGRGGGGWR